MKDTTKALIKGFSFTIFMVICGFASIISLPDAYKVLKPILIILSILSLLISFYYFLSIKIRFKDAFLILTKVKDLGILNIYSTGVSTEKLGKSIRSAKFIKMFFTTGIVFFRSREDDLIKAFENNANMSVIISLPKTDFTREIELIESRKIGEISNEIEQVKTILNRCLKEAMKNTNNQSIGRFTIKQFNTQLRIPYIICDDKYAWITLTLPPARSVQSISFEAAYSDNGLLKKCINNFDEIWSTIDVNKEISTYQNNPIDFLVGEWKNEYQNTGIEFLKITSDYKYLVNGEHWFTIDKLQYDESEMKIIFIKSSVRPNDNRRLLNELKIINYNKLEGNESDYTIKYFRI
jgi:hypothetical protein